ncbi:SDR family oxidoreductase [Fulvivirgaceae bacterium BMA10]|uniref:dTDP-4-dehydrorhamnose reductase n=1 Tax=Splendidivirga corallicola TaxID=3051826 RepID=A0ABT8L0N1_9BACT|nr:SDR family oxidoreductase [Fulvivirgaceae bacterium BMA10]
MKVLITGSNGLLGQKLVELLAKDAAIELIATARGANRLPQTDYSYEYCSLDVTHEQQVLEVIKKYTPDAIIHTAAMTNVDQCESEQEGCRKLNVEAVKYLINAASACGAFLLHLSTDFIFDGSHGPLDEEAEPNPISFYGQSKLDSEKLLIESDIDWAIARTVLVYGLVNDMSRSNIILWVKKSLEEKKEIKVVTDQWRTPTLAEDLAQGCYLIVKKKARGVFNISGEEMLTPYDMALKTAEYFDLDISSMSKANASNFTQPARRPPKTGFIIEKAKKVLGYKPHTFTEGIAILGEQLKEKT